MDKVISNFNGNATHDLVAAAKAIKDFDTAHSNDNDYIDKAMSKSKDILAWLYLVVLDKVTVAPVTSCSSRMLKSQISNLE